MLVSIIIPLYNAREFAAQAIESALRQRYWIKRDFEVVVVNDGSTDGSNLVALEFGSRIRLITQSNSGLAMARNTGIAASNGEFILPLDADDWIEPDYLLRTYPYMDDPKVGIVATDMQREGELHDRVPPRGLTLQDEIRGNDLPVCSLIRRAAFLQTPGYNPQVPCYEDWCLWLDILKRGWKVAVVNKPLFHYRVKSDSMVHRMEEGNGRAQLYRALQKQHPDLFGRIL